MGLSKALSEIFTGVFKGLAQIVRGTVEQAAEDAADITMNTLVRAGVEPVEGIIQVGPALADAVLSSSSAGDTPLEDTEPIFDDEGEIIAYRGDDGTLYNPAGRPIDVVDSLPGPVYDELDTVIGSIDEAGAFTSADDIVEQGEPLFNKDDEQVAVVDPDTGLVYGNEGEFRGWLNEESGMFYGLDGRTRGQKASRQTFNDTGDPVLLWDAKEPLYLNDDIGDIGDGGESG